MFARAAYFVLFGTILHGAHLIWEKPLSGTVMAADGSGNIYEYSATFLTKLDPAGNVRFSKSIPSLGDIVAIAADGDGNVFLAGNSNSDTYPTTNGAFQPRRSPGVCVAGDKSAQQYPCPDATIAKLDSNGNLLWASYLGGLNQDQANAIALDTAGNAYVTGFTLSADFPTAGAFQPKFGGYADAFVTKISADGSRIVYSSFFGAAGYDVAHAIAVSPSGNVYVAGEYQSTAVQAFVFQLDAIGAVVFTRYLGDPAAYSTATAVTVDRQGNVYLGGSTNSRGFPWTAGAWHSVSNTPYINFIAKLAPVSSSLIYSAQFDGDSFGITSIAADNDGSVYAAGSTATTLLPPAGPAMQPCPGTASLSNPLLLKLNPAGSAPTYSSFDQHARLVLAPDGSLYLAGTSLRRITALDQPGDAFLLPACVLNGASFVSHLDYGQPGISPGEIVTLKGTGLGPMTASPDGTQVLFDGFPAPLLYVQDAQINAMAPYNIAGKAQTVIQVKYNGQTTRDVTIPVSPVSPALFEQPNGIPWVLNQNGTVNSADNPVARGGYLTLYLTGGGQTSPPSTDGQVWHTAGGLAAPVTAELDNYGADGAVHGPAIVAYAGPSPGSISGLQQINIQIPANLPDAFVTQKFGPGSVLVITLGSQLMSVSVVVK
jgi:uncharacterized protein (TIGR03437 family)